MTIASRWPVGDVVECDLDVTPRTRAFACTTLIAEVLAPEPLARLWIANHLPDYQLDHEHERCLQAVVAAHTLDELASARPGHVIVAGDFDADPESASVRFWTGRQPLEGRSVCFRDAWESAHPAEAGGTFVPENTYSVDWDWPYRRIDYVLVRCGPHGGPTLSIDDCRRTFDAPDRTASDHYGVVADLSVPRQRSVKTISCAASSACDRRPPLGTAADRARCRARGTARRHGRAVVSTSASQRRASSTSTRLVSTV